MRELTDKPFGMNVALSYVRGSNIIDFVIEQGIKFVTTSSGSPAIQRPALGASKQGRCWQSPLHLAICMCSHGGRINGLFTVLTALDQSWGPGEDDS